MKKIDMLMPKREESDVPLWMNDESQTLGSAVAAAQRI